MRHWKTMMVLAVLVLVLGGGCSGSESLGLGPSPETVTQQWFEALGEFDVARLYELTHPQKRAELEADLENPLVTVGAVLGLAEQDFFEMSYTVVSKDGEIAQVQVTGKVTSRLGMIDDVHEIIDLRKFEGRWYIWSADVGL